MYSELPPAARSQHNMLYHVLLFHTANGCWPIQENLQVKQVFVQSDFEQTVHAIWWGEPIQHCFIIGHFLATKYLVFISVHELITIKKSNVIGISIRMNHKKQVN